MREDIKEGIEMIKKGEVPEGYKETDSGIFPDDWERVKLSQLLKFQNGINAEAGKFGKGIRIISVADILNNQPIVYNNINALIDINEEMLDRYSVTYGDILFQRSSENIEDAGKSNVYLDEKKATFGGFVIRGKKIADYNAIFLNEALRQRYVRKQIMKSAAGVQHINIGQSSLNKIVVYLPKREIQKKISSINYIFEKREVLMKKLILEKVKYKKYLEQNLLTGKKRLEGFTGEWKIQKLSSFFIERSEIKTVNNELLSITGSGIIPRSRIEGKDNSSEDKSKYKKIYVGDIGYNTMRMWQGVSAYSNYEGIVSPAYTILMPKDNADARFFSYLFKLPSIVFKFYRYSQGLVDDTRNLKFENFKKIKVSVPTDIEEQKSIAEIFILADKEIELLQQQLEQIKLEKKAMMQLLLTGIVRVKA